MSPTPSSAPPLPKNPDGRQNVSAYIKPKTKKGRKHTHTPLGINMPCCPLRVFIHAAALRHLAVVNLVASPS